jgi:hypothetical protein
MASASRSCVRGSEVSIGTRNRHPRRTPPFDLRTCIETLRASAKSMKLIRRLVALATPSSWRSRRRFVSNSAKYQLVEGDVARGREGDLLNSSRHGMILRDGRPKASLSALIRHEAQRRPLPLRATPQNRRSGKAQRHEAGDTAFRIGSATFAIDAAISVRLASSDHQSCSKIELVQSMNART